MHPDLQLALALADAADEVTMRHFQSARLSVRTKSDRSPVSEADEETERVLRARLERERPLDAIVGEEFGVTGSSGRRWIIDPIDGTGNYVRGVPVFATLVALQENGKPQIGVVSAPAMQRRWWASAGGGAWCNAIALRVSAVDSLDQAFIGYDSEPDFERHGLGERFLALIRGCHRARGFGDFWCHMLVAEGGLDVAVEPRVELWDMAPVQLIIEEAGGRFTNFSGEPRADGGSAVSTNGRLHDAVLRHLR